KSAQIREILISESAWEEMTCLFAPSLKRLEYQQLSYTNLMMHQVIFMTQNQDLVWLNTTV
ncbi:hypothetical protein FKL54_12560, partial [Klebsiella pneumoniae]|nr:hypothetical protein [Klebsiella pneumoniae]